jgi:hypothetical protein
MVGARGACPISGAKHRAPTIETIVPLAFYEIIKVAWIGISVTLPAMPDALCGIIRRLEMNCLVFPSAALADSHYP